MHLPKTPDPKPAPAKPEGRNQLIAPGCFGMAVGSDC